MMWKDPIVEEVRRIRDEFAAQYDYDIDALYKVIRKAQDESGREIIDLRASRDTASAKALYEPESAAALAVAERGESASCQAD
jgi:hypothetical protein